MARAPRLRDMSLAALEEHLAGLDLEMLKRAVRSLARDPRTGARALAQRVRRRSEAQAAEERRLEEMLRFEWSLKEQGYGVIAGVDEVGRGALAGPLVAAAVVLSNDDLILGVKDSKMLDAAHRRDVAAEIRARARAYAVVRVQADEIDKLGIQLANMVAMRRAVEALELTCDYVLTDGFSISGMDMPTLGLIRGDKRSASIAAASVVAKVDRDELMHRLAADYPGYGFEEHVGYSTAEHIAALRRLGPSLIHRRSFAPVAASEDPELALG